MSKKLALVTIFAVILIGMSTSKFVIHSVVSEEQSLLNPMVVGDSTMRVAVKSTPRTIIVPDNYQTIQGAIDVANLGDIIFVKKGNYDEHLIVDKVVSIFGENKETTVIDGSGEGTVMKMTSDNVTINGFTIRNGGKENWVDSGIALDQVKNCNISGNNIANNGHGVYLYKSCHNSIFGNNITANSWSGIWVSTSSNNNGIIGNEITANNENGGIWLDSSSDNSVAGNNIADNECGIWFCTPSSNSIVENNITNNGYGLWVYVSPNNSIFHNNFLENQQHIYIFKSYGNSWNDDYPSGGNYWSSYVGIDINSGLYQNEFGSDAIGDTPYSIDANNTDHYPLMAPFGTFKSGTGNNVTYNIDIMSSSTVSKFQLNETQKKISFNVIGTDHTLGFCRVSMPNIIVQNLLQSNYIVLVNGLPIEFRNWADSENTYIYFTYQHSEHEVTIIPKFSSIIVPPVFVIVTILAVIIIAILLAVMVNRRKYSNVTVKK
jgi:parallel beta-helix repeat protein